MTEEKIPDCMAAAARVARIKRLQLKLYDEVPAKMQALFDQELQEALMDWATQVNTLAEWVEQGKADMRDVMGEMLGALDILFEEPQKI